MNIKVIGFDADDTLWVNEPYFQEVEKNFCSLISEYLPKDEVSKELYKTEMTNLPVYGYGGKSFVLSMIETAIKVSDSKVQPEIIDNIIQLGKELLNHPVNLLDGVEHVLETLKKKYKLIIATKGDLLDQERKLIKSNLSGYFHHIEIMSDKKEENYSELINHLEIKPAEFLMVGNSLKSDIIPVLNIGGNGIHIPFHTTWLHEVADVKAINGKYNTLEKISDILDIL